MLILCFILCLFIVVLMVVFVVCGIRSAFYVYFCMVDLLLYIAYVCPMYVHSCT